MSRLAPQPDEIIDRSRPVRFTWNGSPVTGFEGDTIVSALMASGHGLTSRSFKYHRPRGPMTASFLDPNTMVQVDDEPNVRAGHRRIREGMTVSAQNAWPSLEFDAKALNGLIGRFLAPGFYYKTFMKPARLWPAYSSVLRRFGAGGTVSEVIPEDRYDARFAHPDVLVAGGGPAGMSAALAAADQGASVMLVEEEQALGGHLRHTSGNTVIRADLVRRVEQHPSIEVLTDSVVTGRYEHNWVAVLQRSHPAATERLIKARVKALVVAAGKIERPYVFDGNDLPGVMLATGVQRLINLYAVCPGTSAVVFTANETGDAVADDLHLAGVRVEIVDARSGDDIVRATGSKRVEGVEISDGRTLEADLLVTAVGWTTPTSLLNMAGVKPVYRPEAARFIPDSLPPDVLATGGVVGDGTVDELLAHGDAIGRIAASRALAVKASWQAASPSLDVTNAKPVDDGEPPTLEPEPHLELYRSTTDGFVDFSEDVRSKDLISAAKEGYDSMELSKRYTTATMGPIQGKLEVGNAVAIHAEAIGADIADVGTTTWRPPYAPISLGALAAATHHAERLSPMQSWHDRNGGVRMRAGAWWRPDHYGDAASEVTNVRTNVGIIDVSPLGKIDLRGRDVVKLLEFAYVNRWAGLDVGRVRYGVMASEDGVVMDDGVTARLGEDHYYMTTTSSGAGGVWNWLDDWLQTSFPDWDVRTTAVTDGYAGINIAGPRSRELLSRLTDLDVSSEAFPYMSVRQGQVAGVGGCRIMRIGFTGELSFEVHAPAGFGLYLWERLIDTGADLGIRPFGVEAQRILRLEKGHFIVGQDTDGLTQGFGLGIDGLIKLDKPDFAGKPELAWQQQRNDHRRLVAIQPTAADLVPPEACQLIDGSETDGWEIVGRITSSRFSPTLGRSIGLAQVLPGYAVPGTEIIVRLPDGSDSIVRVTEHHAHFDPEGTRLRD